MSDDTMSAMVLEQQGAALQLRQVPRPAPQDDELLLRVLACGKCRTDLHVVDGDLTEPRLPLVPGHQVVGEIVRRRIPARRLLLERLEDHRLEVSLDVRCERPRGRGLLLQDAHQDLVEASPLEGCAPRQRFSGAA